MTWRRDGRRVGFADAGRRRHAAALGALACGVLLGGCGISALVSEPEMPVEQRATLYFQRLTLLPLTAGVSEVAVAVTGVETWRREAALAAPGGFAAASDRAAAEAAYQEGLRSALDLGDPFTRFVLAARAWLAGEVDAGRMAPAAAAAALEGLRAEVRTLRARRENFAPAAVYLRRALWQAAPGATLESLQRETELYRRYRLDCPTERTWGRVDSAC